MIPSPRLSILPADGDRLKTAETGVLSSRDKRDHRRRPAPGESTYRAGEAENASLRYAARASRQKEKGVSPISFRRAFSRTEYAGRRALAPKAAESTETTIDGSRPESSKTARAKSAQEQDPSAVM